MEHSCSRLPAVVLVTFCCASTTSLPAWTPRTLQQPVGCFVALLAEGCQWQSLWLCQARGSACTATPSLLLGLASFSNPFCAVLHSRFLLARAFHAVLELSVTIFVCSQDGQDADVLPLVVMALVNWCPTCIFRYYSIFEKPFIYNGNVNNLA